MLRVFLVSSNLTTDPLTIIAPDAEAAQRILEVWGEHHCFAEPIDDVKAYLLSPGELADQPQLGDAVAQGVPGLAYWCGHRLGYLVAAPREAQFGALAPTTPKVLCYVASDDDIELLVFARNVDEAIGLFVVWHTEAHGWRGDGPSDVDEKSRWLLRGPQATLREEMDLERIGIGMVCEDGFWRIFPADYEPAISS